MKKKKKLHTLLMVEGDTECLFYARMKQLFYPTLPCTIINLNGNWDIKKKILDEFESYRRSNPKKTFRVFIAIDRESRCGLAQIDMPSLKKELLSLGEIVEKNIDLFEAIQDIESWFFHDIQGIFNFLRMPGKHRVATKYSSVESLNNKDLSKLFKLADKDYRKGFDSKNFIDNLDLNVIVSGSTVLQRFCSRMK